MTGTWVNKPLGELVSLQRGFDLPTKNRVPGQYPVISAGESIGTHNVAKVKGPGFAIGRITNLGQPHWSDSNFWPLNTTLFATDFHGNNPKWLFYLFKVLDLRGFDSGSVQPSLNRNYISNVSVSTPPRETQDNIVSVLKSLDDKIDVNILIIQESLELLHAQWHAITNAEVSSTQPLSDIADVNPRTPKPQSNECSFLEMKDLPEFGLIVDHWGKRETKGGTKFRNGDVLLARITPCFENGKMAIVDFLEYDEVGMGSTEYIVFRPKEGVPAAAIHAIISSPEFRGFGYKALTGTSGRQRIAADDLKEIAVPWPSESALTEYRQLADVLLKKATALRNENQVLARTRDELLPLLMSGRITVGEAEDAADEAASES